jgi:hypothetical protein
VVPYDTYGNFPYVPLNWVDLWKNSVDELLGGPQPDMLVPNELYVALLHRAPSALWGGAVGACTCSTGARRLIAAAPWGTRTACRSHVPTPVQWSNGT